MQIEFEITSMRRGKRRARGDNEVLGSFDVDVFPFRLREGLIRRRSNGSIYASLPGARTCGWTITAPELRDAIHETALEQWRLSNG